MPAFPIRQVAGREAGSRDGMGKKKAAHGDARPGMLPEACGLLAQTIEQGCNRERVLCRSHLGSGFCAERSHNFTLSVPAAV